MLKQNKALENADGSRIDFNDVSLESLGWHLLFGEVNEDTIKDSVTFLLKANHIFEEQTLTLFVNSMGGSCTDGFALIDIMDISRLPVRTVSSGAIMSMGVLIACAGHKGHRIMTRNTEVMAHQFAWSTGGKFHELVAQNKASEHLARQFLEHFKRHSTMSEDQIKDILFGPTDRWLTPTECKKFGLIDVIIDELPDFNAPLPAPVSPQTRAAGSKRRAR